MKPIHGCVICLLLLAGLSGIASAGAVNQDNDANQPDVAYAINWYMVAGGGGRSASSNYSLTGTIGQYSAGVASGGPFQLAGGFWGHTVRVQQVYLPAVRR